MPGPSICIICAHEPTAGGDPHIGAHALRDAANAGFTALLLKGSFSPGTETPVDLAGLADRCAKAGLRLILEYDLTQFPIDHPLVNRHPGCFVSRRAATTAHVVDPRRPMAASGKALARLHRPEARALLGATLIEGLERLIEQGVGGFHFAQADRLHPDLWRDIRERLRLRDPGLLLLAGPAGENRAGLHKLQGGGLDFLVSSYHWWDLRAAWLIDESEALRPIAPLVSEIRRLEVLETDILAAARRRLNAAAAVASGIILPIEWLEAFPQMIEAAAQAVKLVGSVADFGGEMRRLSPDCAPVTALLRGDASDLRHAKRALLILINTSLDIVPAPTTAEMAQASAGWGDFTPLRADGDAASPLDPGEVRLLTATRPAPILTSDHTACPPTEQPARLVIQAIEPKVDGGDFAVKRVVGDSVPVAASIFADGHAQLGAELHWRALDDAQWSRVRMTAAPNDRWQATFDVPRMGRYEFMIEGWLDHFGGFRRDLEKKRDAAVAQPVDYAEGLALVADAIQRSKGSLCTALKRKLTQLENAPGDQRADLLLETELAELMDAADDRPHRIQSARQLVDAERLQARYSSWYELFPRSMAPLANAEGKPRHGTFADVIEHLPRVRAMGFDTLYLPPIHPIGTTNRKGRNNSLTPTADDPGSPYAIGSAEGGHDAIHPELGSLEDFDRLVAVAHQQGLEIALDFAIQASPDHPWLKEHPGWFAWRPDGSMRYAENPPKKYQDIVNMDFYGPDAVPGLWEALRDVILLWVDHGVKAFRVDNPHTKPLPFWEWLIDEVRARAPDVLFLSEAFTRPTMMYHLAKLGFSQSYSYFTWRDGKQELVDYFTELTTQTPREYYRPHLFVNTPDINPFFLQTSGRAGFQIRAVLAATLSGLFGVYSGFELCEAAPLGPGKEEYLDSEKYEIRPRDWTAPGNIIADIALLNRLRRSHPALQTHLNTRFYTAHNDSIIWYGKPSPGGDELIMVMVNLDPHNAQACDFEVPLWEFGLADDASIAVEDLAQGHKFDWQGKLQSIRITPDLPYRIWRLSAPGAPA